MLSQAGWFQSLSPFFLASWPVILIMNLYRVSQKTHFQNCHQLASNCQNHCHQKFWWQVWQFWECVFWGTLYVSIIKININRSAPRGRRGSGGGGVWLGGQGVGWHLQVGAELIIIRMVALKQLIAYYMSMKYEFFDQIIHQGATMTVRSLSLFVTRTTMLLVNIDTQTYSSECWKFLICIWHYKILSVYWTSTVHWLDLRITRFLSIAIPALRRSSRRVYFLLVGLADHCGPTSVSPCIGKNLLSSSVLISTLWLFSSDLLLYLPSLLLFVPLLLHTYRLHLLLLSLLFERILANKLKMINVMKPVIEKYTTAVQESTLTMYNSTHHLLSSAFFPQDLNVPNIHDKI